MKKHCVTKAVKALLVLLAAALLSGCGSQLTSIDAPANVLPGETFTVTVTHTTNEDGPFPIFVEPDITDGALVFAVALPVGWTVNSPAQYTATWDGSPISLDVLVQPGPPETDWVDILLAAQDLDPPPTQEELDFINTLDCKNLLDRTDVLPPGFKWVFLRSNPPGLPDIIAVDGDTGTLEFEVTAGGPGGDYNLLVIHGLYGTLPADLGEEQEGELEEDVEICAWISEDTMQEPGDDLPFIIPSNVNVEITQTGSSAGNPSVPVPVGSAPVLALLILLLGAVGVSIGRRQGHF
jgi:hypothetical protein